MSDNLPAAVTSRGINEAQWSTLRNSLFPGAQPESILMAIDYCRARKLDPMKKPCHIVPIYVRDAKTGQGSMRDVIMPGIYEYRTTAQRTGQYMGRSRAEFGPVGKFGGVEAPEWCEVTVYRWHEASQSKVEFPARVLFREVCATKQDGNANQRWAKAPVQMLEKCAEAAALRSAFPDELGGEMTVEEMEGRTIIDAEPVASKPATEAPQAAPAPSGQPTPATESQVKLIGRKLEQSGVPLEDFLEAFNVPDTAALTFDAVNPALAWIKENARA